MTAFDSTKYDIRLNNTDFRISNYMRAELPTFVPRVAAGSQSESEFNTLLCKTLQSFKGGMLQREWKDDNAFFASEFLYPIYDDGVLYPVGSTMSTTTNFGSGRPVITAEVSIKDYAFISWYSTSGGSQQGIKRIDSSGTVSSLTVPANISNKSFIITDIEIWEDNLWVTASNIAGTDGRMYVCPLSGTTLTEVSAGSGAFYLMTVHNNQLYGTNYGSTANSYLYRYTGSTTTRSFTASLAEVPSLTAALNARLLVFNNQVTLARHDGIFAYNGISGFVHLDDQTAAPNDLNFRFATVYKGFLHYWMPDGMYRSTGSIVEKLFDISEIGFPVDVITGKDRLWILYRNSDYAGSSRYDRSLGYDYNNTDQCDGRVAVYNGSGIYTYARTATFNKAAVPSVADEGENHSMSWFRDNLYIFTFANPSDSHIVVSTDESVSTGQAEILNVSSIFDGGFPMVDKNIESIELVMDGTVTNADLLAIEYRTSGFDGSGGWQVLGAIDVVNELKRFTWLEVPNGITGRRFQFRLSGDLTVGAGIAKFIVRYTLNPDYKWKWNFDIMTGSDTDTGKLRLANGDYDTQSVRTLRGAVYAARQADVPVHFIDLDKTHLGAAMISSGSSQVITLNSTKLLKGESGFIIIDEEIMYWSNKTNTQVTVLRQQLGTSAAAHAINSPVYPLYRVQVSIGREIIDIVDTDRSTEDVDFASRISVELREV